MEPSRCSTSVTTLPPEPGIPRPCTTSTSPVLVLGTKETSEGSALINAADYHLHRPADVRVVAGVGREARPPVVVLPDRLADDVQHGVRVRAN
jgi:hypothetical protein